MSLSVEQMHHEKSLLLFRVEPYRICVPSVDVEAIITVPTFRSIPHAPFAMRGVFSYRGQIASLISLRRKFGLQDYKDANTGQLILARISCGLTGFWVDEVLDIVASTGEDVIALTVLSRLTVFDHFLILDDQIAQHTTFEQIYQARDAIPRKRSPEPSVLDQEVEDGQGEEADDRPSAGTAEVIQLDTAERARGGADPAVCGAADENARQPDANEKGLEAPPGRKFDSAAGVVDLRSHRTKNQDASSTFRLKSRSAPTVIKRSKQSSYQSGRRQTAVAAVNLSGRYSRGKAAYQPAADSDFQPGVADRNTRQKRFSIFTAGILLLAGLILLTYWLWPQDKRFLPVSHVLETEKIAVSADPMPVASSKDSVRELRLKIERQKNAARPIPTWDNSAVAEKVTGSVTSTGETHGDSAGEPRSEVEEEQNTARPTPTWNDNADAGKVTGSVTTTGEISRDSAREPLAETEEEQNAARLTPTWDDNANAEKGTGSVTATGEIPGDSARELRSENEEEQNTTRPTPTWDENVVAEKVTGPVISSGGIPGDSVRELRSEIEEEQNTVRPNPTWDDSADAEKVTGPATSTGEITGDSARELPSENEEGQNAAGSTPVMDHSAVAEEVTGSIATTGGLPGDSDRELPSELVEEQNAAQSNPAWDNRPVAEKASDSVTTGEKVEEKIGTNAGGEPKTEPAFTSHGAQTASMKAPITDESADQLLKIETDDFTLTIERGQSGKTHQPLQTASAPAERTGETEPLPTGPAPVVTTEHTHIVVKGDTLWDIAAKYLRNPFRYPELAKLSRIKDSHWIYPGDLIRIIKKKVPEARN